MTLYWHASREPLLLYFFHVRERPSVTQGNVFFLLDVSKNLREVQDPLMVLALLSCLLKQWEKEAREQRGFTPSSFLQHRFDI